MNSVKVSTTDKVEIKDIASFEGSDIRLTFDMSNSTDLEDIIGVLYLCKDLNVKGITYSGKFVEAIWDRYIQKMLPTTCFLHLTVTAKTLTKAKKYIEQANALECIIFYTKKNNNIPINTSDPHKKEWNEIVLALVEANKKTLTSLNISDASAEIIGNNLLSNISKITIPNLRTLSLNCRCWYLLNIGNIINKFKGTLKNVHIKLPTWRTNSIEMFRWAMEIVNPLCALTDVVCFAFTISHSLYVSEFPNLLLKSLWISSRNTLKKLIVDDMSAENLVIFTPLIKNQLVEFSVGAHTTINLLLDKLQSNESKIKSLRIFCRKQLSSVQYCEVLRKMPSLVSYEQHRIVRDPPFTVQDFKEHSLFFEKYNRIIIAILFGITNVRSISSLKSFSVDAFRKLVTEYL